MVFTKKTYMIPFYEHNIHTTVTKDPDCVTTWITKTENINSRHLHHLVIGLVIESQQVENRISILQLCVGTRCLIFQIIHSPYIPQSLIDFLNNPNYTFTCDNIHEHVEKLVHEYGLSLGVNVAELGSLAATIYGDRMKELGLKELAKVVLDKDPEKARLCPEQVEYSTIDGFLSFEIGRVLITMGRRKRQSMALSTIFSLAAFAPSLFRRTMLVFFFFFSRLSMVKGLLNLVADFLEFVDDDILSFFTFIIR